MRCARREFLARVSAAAGLSHGFWSETFAAASGDLVRSTLVTRKEELSRRVGALDRELKQWQAQAETNLDANAHFSQIQAIRILMGVFVDRQKEVLDSLDPQGEALAFLDTASDIVAQIVRSQFVWEFFREKFQLRYDPFFKDSLWVADTVAWDCYRPTLLQAADFGILSRDEMREPPLCYYTAEFSPATWIRGSYPADLRDRNKGEYRTPIPVIELPWDHAQNLWEFVTLAHEVGHDLEADLKLREPLLTVLQAALQGAGVPGDRVMVWKDWQAECFADLVGLQLAGPAFAEVLMHLLLLPANKVTAFDGNDPHPTHYVRILLNAAYIRTLITGDAPADLEQRAVLSEHADRIEAGWKALYGDVPQLEKFLQDFPIVSKALMDTQLPQLKNHSVRELVPYTSADDRRIRATSSFLQTGQNRPNSLRPRHVAAAARLAVSETTAQGADLENALRDVNERTADLVRDGGPMGLRGYNASNAHKLFIASFADRI